MNKKLIILTVLTLICGVLLVSCNDSTPDFSDFGFTISGKITLHDLPDNISKEITIFANNEEVATADDNGMFSVKNLQKGDEITFYMENVEFYPEKHTVRGDVYDLRIDGYYVADNGNDNPNNNPDNNDNNGGNNNDNDNGDNGSNDGNNQGNNDGNSGDNNDTNKNVYNCINGGLLFENYKINFVFCVNKDFSALVVSSTINGISNPIDIDESMAVGEYVSGQETYIQYSVDVTLYATQECSFSAVAYNSDNTAGSVASVTFAPIGVCESATISLTDNILTISGFDDSAVHYLIVNGVAVCQIESTTIDLNTIFTHDESNVTISVLSYKTGFMPAMSNEIVTTLNIYDI